MKLIVVAFIFAMLAMSIPALADDIYQYNGVVELSETANYELNVILVNYTTGILTLPIQGSPYGLIINSSVRCSTKDYVWGKEITCYPNSFDKIAIKVSYKLSDKPVKKNSFYLFSDFFTMPENVKKMSFIVKMPAGMGLVEDEQSYTPEDALLGSDGQRTFLLWNRENMQKGEKFDVSVAYEDFGKVDYFMVEIIVIILAIVIIVSYVVLKYFSREKPVKVIETVLKEDEKKIFDALIMHEPGINQKIIVTESGYSKAKVSKVLKSLQERGLVKLERSGRKNKVFYDPKLRKKD